MEVIASTIVRREFKHEVYMKTKKSMELVKWDNFIGRKVIINPVFDGKKIPGRGVSPWVLESVLRVIKEKYPDAHISIINPEWPKACKKYAKIVKKAPLEGDLINIGVLRYGAEKILNGKPLLMIIDATVCWAGGARVCDTIITSASKKAMVSALKKLYGGKEKHEYRLIGELPKIRLKKEGFFEAFLAKRYTDQVLNHPLYSQEFS
ncbi:MAG: hypothetical protein ACOCZQ_03530 [Nanoarchaeota archaeon]